jgi:hypothetical protein
MKKIVAAVITGIALSSSMSPAIASADTGSSKKATAARAPSTVEFDKKLAQAQEQMNTMRAQMDQIRQAQDPQERQRLLQQHWTTMQSTMSAMDDLWGPSMMGPGMMGSGGMMGGAGGGWGHMGGYYSKLTPEQLRQHQYMNDQYLNMQQQMMNNMMLNQQYWMGPPAPIK